MPVVEGAMSERPDVTITIVSWNTAGLLRECLRALERGASEVVVEVHVVDNASNDGSPEVVRKEFPTVLLLESEENVGFAPAANRSWVQARGRYWLLLNSDARTGAGAIDELVRLLDRRPRAGLATARLVGTDDSPQHCAQVIPTVPRTLLEASRLHKLLPRAVRSRVLLGPYFGYDVEQKLGWTWGTALMARREAVEAVGPLSDYFFLYGEDLDWCLRMRASGWEVWFCPTADVTHHGAASAPEGQSEDSRHAMIQERIFEAMACHRSPARMAALHAATAFGGAVDCIVAAARHRSAAISRETLRFHLVGVRNSLSAPNQRR